MIAHHRHIQVLFNRMTKALTARQSRRERAKVEADEVIATLASATCPVAHGWPVTVAKVIEQDAAYHDHAAVLEANGVILTAGRRGRRGSFRAGKTRIFVDPEAVTGHLLHQTRWSARDVSRALLGVPGTERRQRSVGGRRRRGIEMPLTVWLSRTKGGAVSRGC